MDGVVLITNPKLKLITCELTKGSSEFGVKLGLAYRRKDFLFKKALRLYLYTAHLTIVIGLNL